MEDNDQPAQRDDPMPPPDNTWAKTVSVRKDVQPDTYESKQRPDK